MIVLAVGFVGIVLGWWSTNRQIGAAGGEPRESRYVYASEGGVSRRTSMLMLLAWALAFVGVVLVVIGLL